MAAKRKVSDQLYLKLSPHVKNELVQPFLKWAGGKRQLMTEIQRFIPKKFNTYFEPFVGGGALFFQLQHKAAVINDRNAELINCYNVIKSEPEELLRLCRLHRTKNSARHYYELRSWDREPDFQDRSPVQRAARILYLNKTCFNGLFRVNSQGQFNVPYGTYNDPLIANEAIIKAIHTYLNASKVTMLNTDFADAVKKAKARDFVYFDPPYDPLSDTSSFTGYDINNFDRKAQERLKDTCDKLVDRGCFVLVSNSCTDFINKLYKDNRYEIVEVEAKRAINSVGSKRGRISEVLIHSKYEPKPFKK